MKYNETAVLIDELELFVMAALKGKKQIYGFSGVDTGNLKKEELIMVMQKLCLHGIAEIRERQLVLSEPYDSFVADICKASYVLTIRTADNMRPMLCCYSGQPPILVESTGRKTGELRVFGLSEGGIVEYLKLNGYLPGTDDFGKSFEEEQKSDYNKINGNETKEEIVLNIKAANAVDGTETGDVYICRGELFYTIEVGGRKLRYSEANLKKVIDALLCGSINVEVM